MNKLTKLETSLTRVFPLFILSLLTCKSVNAQTTKLFYIDNDKREIRTVDPSGTNNAVFFKNTTHLSPRSLKVNNTTQEVFFSTASPYNIFKMGMDGKNEQSIYLGTSQIYQIDIDETNAKVYWAESTSIKRANLDGSSIQTIVGPVTDVSYRSVTTSGTKMYWVERHYNTSTFVSTVRLKQANLDGTAPVTIHTEVIPNLGTPVHISSTYEIQVDAVNNEVYWGGSTPDGIFKKNTNGTGSVTTVINSTHSMSLRGLVLDVPNNKIYFTETHSSFDQLKSCNLNGTNVAVLASADDPHGLDLAVVTQAPVGIQEIDVQGNQVTIADNDITPATTDNTDFGLVDATNGDKLHYYFIRNLGGSSLTLGGAPVVAISGAHAADFTVQQMASGPVTASSSTYFTIKFDPSAVGARNAIVTITNNDADEGTYNFNITGEGVLISGETGPNDMRITTHATGASLDNDDPCVAYDSANNRFLVVFEKEKINSDDEAYGQFVNGTTGALIGSEFAITNNGPVGNTSSDVYNPKVVFNKVSKEYFVVFRMDRLSTMNGIFVNNEIEVYGQRVSPTGTLLGGTVRISQMGPDGNVDFGTGDHTVTYNTKNGDYLVAWSAPLIANDQVEIFGQRVSSAGTVIGGLGNETRFSSVSNADINASSSSVTYNPDDDEYLLVYRADFPSNNIYNIYSQRITNAGALNGSRLQVTSLAGSRDAGSPQVIYNKASAEYFVVYQSDLLVDNVQHIHGQRITSNNTLNGSNTKISVEVAGSISALAYNSTTDQILVMYQSVHPSSTAYDIYASTLDASTYAFIETNSRVSDMGILNSNASYTGKNPCAAFNKNDAKFLIVWEGDDEAPNGLDGEDEIYGQLWQAPPSLTPIVCAETNDLALLPGTYTSAATGVGSNPNYICFCDANNKLLLALDTNGTGAVIPLNGVQLRIGANMTTSWITSGGIVSNEFGGAIFNRQWDVSPSVQPTTGDVKVKYYFTNTEYLALKDTMANHNGGATNYPTTINAVTDLEMFKLTGGTPFADPHGAGAVGTLLANGMVPGLDVWVHSVHGTSDHAAEFTVSSFSGGGGGIGGGGAPLPVEWIDFRVSLQANGAVHLNWRTASELNSAGFEIERSYDGVYFNQIGTVASTNTNSIQTYLHEDLTYDNSVSVIYYRIKQVDYNGVENYAAVRKVNLTGKKIALNTTVYPNPSSGDVNLAWNSQSEGETEVTVYTIQGKQVFNQKINSTLGYQMSSISLKQLKAGIYLLQIQNGSRSEQTKLIIK